MEKQLITLEEQYTRSIATFQNGSQVLAENNDLVAKIRNAGRNIIDRIQANGGELTPELDTLCNDFIAKANQRLKEMNEKRAPITQMLTAVQKLFTGLEAQLDIKKPDTEMAILQSFRNDYAKKLAEEKKRKEEEAAKVARKAQDAIQLRSQAEVLIANFFTAYLTKQKSELQARFNALSLEVFDKSAEALQGYNPELDLTKLYGGFKHSLVSYTHQLQEIDAIVDSVLEEKTVDMPQTFKSEMLDLKADLIAKLPSKKAELEVIAQAGEEEKKRLEEARKQREAEEAERLKKEAEEAERQAELKAQADAAAAETMVLFEKEAAMTVEGESPETREGYEIKIHNNAAYVLIFQMFWEHEGRNLSAEKLEKKSIGQMKKFCETLAHKQNIKIESKFLTYEPTYKAVNRK